VVREQVREAPLGSYEAERIPFVDKRLALSKRPRATGCFAGTTGTTTLDAGRPACAQVALALDATRSRWPFPAGPLIATPPIINARLTSC